MAATANKVTIFTRLRRAPHTETPRGLALQVYIYINRAGSGTVAVHGPKGVSVPFGNIGQGISIVAELMGAKAKVAARTKR